MYIMQWNARSIKNKKEELTKYLVDHNIQIAAITETWLAEPDLFHISGYNIIRNDREDGKGGICFLIQNKLPYDIVQIHTNEDLSKTQYIKIRIFNMTLINIYNPPPNKICRNYWGQIILDCQEPYLIMGDFNIHHTVWSTHSSKDGQMLLEVIESTNTFCLNNGAPTHISYNTMSTPDITMFSQIIV